MTFAWARRFICDLVAFMHSLGVLLPSALAVLLVVWVAASPWALCFSGGWRLLLRWYLLPYPFVLLGFALIVAFFNRRELLVRVRNWRAARESKKLRLRKAA